MNPTTTGRFRVLDGTEDDEWLFVDVGDPGTTDPEEAYAPTYVPKAGHGDLDDAVADLRPGYLVAATMEWVDGQPRVEELNVERRTLFEFVDDATGIFEAAQQTWAEAAAVGEPMNSQVTYGTDGEPNGVLYVFAKQSGAQDLFEEFRSGVKPIEPLIERVEQGSIEDHEPPERDGPDEVAGSGVSLGPGGNLVVEDDENGSGAEGEEDAREVFVMRPADEQFVLVYIVLRKGGLLADTVRDTYHCPRPEER